jgi:periplasmic protein TonB
MVIAMDDDRRDRIGQIVRIAVPAVVGLSVAAAIIYALHDTAGARREAPPIATMVAVLPPPPPPPPQEKPPEPDKKVEPVEKLDQPKAEEPPRQLTINGPAQAGTDAFNIGAGSGGGMVASGGGFGTANYGHYLSVSLQQAIAQNDSLNRLVFSADVAIWVDETGHVTQAKIVRSSGELTTDAALVAALQEAPALDQPPPPEFQFPQRIAVSGRRPG